MHCSGWVCNLMSSLSGWYTKKMAHYTQLKILSSDIRGLPLWCWRRWALALLMTLGPCVFNHLLSSFAEIYPFHDWLMSSYFYFLLHNGCTSHWVSRKTEHERQRKHFAIKRIHLSTSPDKWSIWQAYNCCIRAKCNYYNCLPDWLHRPKFHLWHLVGVLVPFAGLPVHPVGIAFMGSSQV